MSIVINKLKKINPFKSIQIYFNLIKKDKLRNIANV